jgi:hypothetical protein
VKLLLVLLALTASTASPVALALNERPCLDGGSVCLTVESAAFGAGSCERGEPHSSQMNRAVAEARAAGMNAYADAGTSCMHWTSDAPGDSAAGRHVGASASVFDESYRGVFAGASWSSFAYTVGGNTIETCGVYAFTYAPEAGYVSHAEACPAGRAPPAVPALP